ncbi:hypothetical protein EDC05_005675 [Coemansia umbellata]|nr:hypothetical protein EDC05_005675 [Coemansia umbellata]
MEGQAPSKTLTWLDTAELVWPEFGTSISVLLAFSILILLIIIYRIVYAYYISPLRHIPGSFISRITAKRGEIHTILGNMSYLGGADSEKYGDIFVILPNAISIGNPMDIRNFLGNPNVAKAHYYKILRFTGIDNTVSMCDTEQALIRHRQIGPYFKPTYLAKLETTIMKCGIGSIKQKWNQVLSDSADGKVEINFCNDILFASFNIIGTLVYGHQIEELSVNDTATAQWIDTTITYLGFRSMLQLLPKFPFSFMLKPWESRYSKLSRYIHESIAWRRKHVGKLAEKGLEHGKPADLLQAFIDAEDPESKIRMCHEQIHGECMLMMLAGSDTTAHTLTWAVHMLMLYPQHYRRAVAEVRSQFSLAHVITYSDCREHLPFVEACILESLRLVPVTGGLLPRVSPKGGTVIQGHFIPEDTLVFINMAVANHHSEFWSRPHEYNPVRFLENNEARHNVLTFSYGKRTCPGRQLAWWEMLTILANILKDYDMRLPEDYTHLGPKVLDKHGYPKLMDAQQYIVVKPANPDRDCRLVISKAKF